jgi:hypothetical protein
VSSCKQTSKAETVNEHEAMLPEGSAAVQMTVVTPEEKVEPDGGVQTTLCMEQLSSTVGGG